MAMRPRESGIRATARTSSTKPARAGSGPARRPAAPNPRRVPTRIGYERRGWMRCDDEARSHGRPAAEAGRLLAVVAADDTRWHRAPAPTTEVMSTGVGSARRAAQDEAGEEQARDPTADDRLFVERVDQRGVSGSTSAATQLQRGGQVARRLGELHRRDGKPADRLVARRSAFRRSM